MGRVCSQEVTLQADVYQALALTQPQAHTLRTLEAGYRMDRAHLQQGMVDSLAVSSKAQHGVPEELRAEALRTGGGLQAGSGHGTVCYAAAAPAGSHSTSPPRTAPCSIDAAGNPHNTPAPPYTLLDTCAKDLYLKLRCGMCFCVGSRLRILYQTVD